MKKINTQEDWINRAKEVLPAAGFGNFENDIIIKRGKGSKVWDENNNEYIDYLIGSGPMLLGHGHPEVMEAIFQQLPNGLTFFANNSKGIELAEEICKAVKSSEQVRFVSSGGEADMYAMRLARAFTGKDKIIKLKYLINGSYVDYSNDTVETFVTNLLTYYSINLNKVVSTNSITASGMISLV